MQREALQFIEKNQEQPFFLYYPTPISHLALQAPERAGQQALRKGEWKAFRQNLKQGQLVTELYNLQAARTPTAFERWQLPVLTEK